MVTLKGIQIAKKIFPSKGVRYLNLKRKQKGVGKVLTNTILSEE